MVATIIRLLWERRGETVARQEVGYTKGGMVDQAVARRNRNWMGYSFQGLCRTFFAFPVPGETVHLYLACSRTPYT